MSERETELRRMTRTLWVLWAAFLSAAILYLVVGFLVARGRGAASTPPGSVGQLKPIFYALGGVLLILAFVVRRQLMNRAYREPYAAMIGLQAAMVAGWAMSEAVAILGLILVLLGGSIAEAVPFIAVTLAAIGLQRPDGDGLRRHLDALH
jgi:FtsH-binding integral membrane protein